MKKIILFSLLVATILSSCKDDQPDPGPSTPDPETSTHDYKLIYTQSGDYEHYARYFAIGKGWVFDDTGEDAPDTFLNDPVTIHLPKETYIFRTKNPVKSIDIHLTLMWTPTTPNPSSMKATIQVYRGEELIESSEVSMTHDDDNGEIYNFNTEGS